MNTTVEPQAAPSSKESEMMVLGCMLTNQSSLKVSSETLDSEDFFYSEHEIIFRSLQNFYRQDKPADIHLVCEDLKRQGKLNEVGGAAYITTLAQYAGTSAYIEEYAAQVKEKSALRRVFLLGEELQKKALESPEDSFYLLEDLEREVRSIKGKKGKNIPIIDTSHRLKQEAAFLEKHRGKKYLGLTVETIKEFNENFLGLRGLMLLAAAPNVGKTALTVQLALEVLSSQEDTCLVYISLEMSEEQIFRRMLLNLSEKSFRTFVFGSQKQSIFDNEGRAAYFTEGEIEDIECAQKKLLEFGNRLQIIDQSTCPYIDSQTVANYVEALKERTKTSKAIVIIDYLQVWPIPPNTRLSNENEIDKWRIGEMKKIRDAMNKEEEPVIVISEARKPSGGKEGNWGGEMSDVMGSARGTYTPDVVTLLSQVPSAALKSLWEANNLPKVPSSPESKGEEGASIKNFLSKNGIAICRLDTPKARDGMQKFSTLLEFHFHRNKFKKVNWSALGEKAKATLKTNQLF